VIALIPVRDGVLPAGSHDCVVEAHGHALVVGRGAGEAAGALAGVARSIGVAETDAPFARLVAALATRLSVEDVVVLPTAPDGRDLAPPLARAMGRPLVTGALAVTAQGATATGWLGRTIEEVVPSGPFVATLQPCGGATAPSHAGAEPVTHPVALVADDAPAAVTTALPPPDVASMDLAEAPRILGGGAGLDGEARFVELAAVAAALGAAMGGTRVITDRGWIAHERQIGTTGVTVRPELYVAFGVSGAVQHTAGLGDPAHVISVNTDPHCPMMQLADLAVVADANATLDALARLVGVEP
jgi:electron transfer flavoprotein alpha subunit